MNTSSKPHKNNPRQRLYKLLAVGNRDLQSQRHGFCDEDYRAILQQCGATEKKGKISATTMTVPELEGALTRLKNLGFKVRRLPRVKADWRAPRIAKLNAMWFAMADAGVVHDRSQEAMQAFCCTKVRTLSKLQWATTQQLNQCVEMLKKYADRTNVKLRD
ncbi:MAG: regulatory protein GemA [Porticoccaceae bacterium]|nr:regulatory protein GemA [Porticoccaceae bacterium]